MAEQGLDYLLGDTKRLLDITSASICSLLLAPGIAATGLAAAIDSRSVSGAFFLQQRIGGKGERAFTVSKFRTLTKHLGRQAAYASYGTFDPRASTIGQLIRRVGMDETPQLAHVVAGNMSMVGPRPLPVEELERFESVEPKLFDEWFSYFQEVRPGLTGRSQLYRRREFALTDEVIRRSMQMDVSYFESATVAEDMYWIGATLPRLIHAMATSPNRGVA